MLIPTTWAEEEEDDAYDMYDEVEEDEKVKWTTKPDGWDIGFSFSTIRTEGDENINAGMEFRFQIKFILLKIWILQH